MSAILVAVAGPQAGEWIDALRAHAKGRELRAWPDAIGDPNDIAYACVWLAPHGLLAKFHNLKVITNLGAGVDHLLADPHLPTVPMVRVAHPDLTMRVTEYVVLHVLMHHRQQRLYDAQQRERVWRVHDQPAASEVAVGVMGLGVIGRKSRRRSDGSGSRLRAGAAHPSHCWYGSLSGPGWPGWLPEAYRNSGLPVAADAGHRRDSRSSRCSASSSAMARPAARS